MLGKKAPKPQLLSAGCSDGLYYSDLLGKCIACSANCSVCTDKKTCTQCDSPFTLSDGLCLCVGGYRNSNLNCIICPDYPYTYTTSSECLACPDNCTDCQSPSGACNTCTDPFIPVSDGSCGCAIGFYISGGTCVEATATCPDG
jgi:hypothetical protein